MMFFELINFTIIQQEHIYKKWPQNMYKTKKILFRLMVYILKLEKKKKSHTSCINSLTPMDNSLSLCRRWKMIFGKRQGMEEKNFESIDL